MPYLFIENFETGLDDRKTKFTAPPGSLREIKNAHITRGKEIERRKAFPSVATLPAGTKGLHASQDELIVFGSSTLPAGMPAVVQYQQLTSPNGGDLVQIYDHKNFAGYTYVVAGFTGGSVHHFYNGALVDDWETLAASTGESRTVANALGQRLAEDDSVGVVVVANKIILTSTVAGVAFTVTVSAGLTVTETQAASAAVPETIATSSFEITGGTEGATFNTISSVSVDGNDLIGAPVDFTVDNATTADAVALKINTGLTAYSASTVGAVVTISAPAGLGASANGRVLSATSTGDVTVGGVTNFASGTDPIAAIAEVSEVLVGTYGGATLFTVTLNGTTYDIRGDASAMPLAVKAVKQKMYAVTGSLLHFSGFSSAPAVADPTKWINDPTGPPIVVGAGFIDMAQEDGGSESLIGMGIYQDKIATFAKRSVQIWTVDPDPNFNQPYQVLLNVGSISAGSILEYGDLDIFFLSESGIRSLRARDSSNLASANDVGVSVDKGLTDYMNSIPSQQIRRAKSIVEPVDSRYLLAIGSRIYVFSNFPGSRVAAWSTYELDGVITGSVEDWAIADGKLHARVGDEILRYGGISGNQYDTTETVITLPFLDASNPAMMKLLDAIDAGTIGVWKVEVATEPNNPDVWETIGTLTDSTYGSVQAIGAAGASTHFALRLTTSVADAAIIGNLIIHYKEVAAT